MARGTRASDTIFMVRRAMFDTIGWFHRVFEPAYWEDTDLCDAAWKRGWSSYYIPTAECWHRVSSTAKALPSDFKQRMMEQHHTIFYLANIGTWRGVREHLAYLLRLTWERIRKGDKRWHWPFGVLVRRLLPLMRLRMQRRRVALLSDDEVLARAR